ncbi:MAG: response regulator [candidate division KSB1 bacterium]|nr:response regulator [candidate division KSB1 bacterium]
MNRRPRILIVDDEPTNREVLTDMLVRLGYECETARDGFEALGKLNLDIDLILLDVMMPGMDGYEVAKAVRNNAETRDIPIMMITALGSREDRLKAVEAGANDFLTKPIDTTELKVRTESLLKLKQAYDALREHERQLQETVAKRTAALRKALEEMARANRRTYQAYVDTLHRLALAAEYKDSQTSEHLRRVSLYSTILAAAAGLSPGDVEIIRHAAPMHDVGKIGIPDSILQKPGRLTPQEMETMRQHTVIGAKLLSGSPSRLLQVSAIVALTHHERWDGKGYPRGLAGDQIPVWGRICAIADVFDALTTERPYKEALSFEQALELMREGKGSQFDPHLLDLFESRFDRIVSVAQRTNEDPSSVREVRWHTDAEILKVAFDLR